MGDQPAEARQTATAEASPSASPARRALESLHGRVSRWVARPLFWFLAIAVLAGWPIVRSVSKTLPEPRPVLGKVPTFAFVDQRGQPYGSEQLEGKVWVANFFFTRCPTICPRLTQRMFEVQHRSRNIALSFRIVSFSVDPEFDTPPVLRKYAAKYKANPARWHFVTGELDEVRDTVVRGFKVSMQGQGGDPSQVVHGSHVVLVDRRLRIRGYYDVNDDEALDRLLRDAGLLLARGN